MDKKKLIYSICGVLIVLVAIFMVLNLKDNKKNKGKEVYTSDIKKTKEDSLIYYDDSNIDCSDIN